MKKNYTKRERKWLTSLKLQTQPTRKEIRLTIWFRVWNNRPKENLLISRKIWGNCLKLWRKTRKHLITWNWPKKIEKWTHRKWSILTNSKNPRPQNSPETRLSIRLLWNRSSNMKKISPKYRLLPKLKNLIHSSTSSLRMRRRYFHSYISVELQNVQICQWT